MAQVKIPCTWVKSWAVKERNRPYRIYGPEKSNTARWQLHPPWFRAVDWRIRRFSPHGRTVSLSVPIRAQLATEMIVDNGPTQWFMPYVSPMFLVTPGRRRRRCVCQRLSVVLNSHTLVVMPLSLTVPLTTGSSSDLRQACATIAPWAAKRLANQPNWLTKKKPLASQLIKGPMNQMLVTSIINYRFNSL